MDLDLNEEPMEFDRHSDEAEVDEEGSEESSSQESGEAEDTKFKELRREYRKKYRLKYGNQYRNKYDNKYDNVVLPLQLRVIEAESFADRVKTIVEQLTECESQEESYQTMQSLIEVIVRLLASCSFLLLIILRLIFEGKTTLTRGPMLSRANPASR